MFIKLNCANGEQLRINMDFIESYGVINENSYGSEQATEEYGYTYVLPHGGDDHPYIVKETPAQIDVLISYAKENANG